MGLGSGFCSASGSASTIDGLNGKEKEKDAVGISPSRSYHGIPERIHE